MSESVSGMAAAVRSGNPDSASLYKPVFVSHGYSEHLADLGEISMNYVSAGSSDKPALLLIPGQTESWWGYEKAIRLLENDFQVFAVDLRGQGRSTWTPRRYTLDNMGNDLVRFIAMVIKRPVVTSGCSSGGVLSAWLSAFAMPGQLRGAIYEDAPLFASETNPIVGQSIRQAAGPVFRLYSKYLGDQWSVGDWKGLQNAAGRDAALKLRGRKMADDAPQNMKEYDAEWSRAFWEGTVAKSCPHEIMLSQVKVPVLITHHAHSIDANTGNLLGAMSDLQVQKALEIIKSAGVPTDYLSLPDAAHAMHMADPPRFAAAVRDWALRLPR